MKTIKPNEDGVKHLNIYSRGRTELGRLLSNFAYSPFLHPEYGSFHSMEGYYYWHSTGQQHANLRVTAGPSAKLLGRTYPRVDMDRDELLAILHTGLIWKTLSNANICRGLVNCDLPFCHYYLFGYPPRVVEAKDSEWLINGYDEIRYKLWVVAGKIEDYKELWVRGVKGK